MKRGHGTLRAGGWLALAAVGGIALWWSWSALPAPDGWSPAALKAWVAVVGPAIALFALVRALASLAVVYLLVMAAIALVAQRSAHSRARGWAKRVCPPLVWRLAARVVGFGLGAAALAVAGASPATADHGPDHPTHRAVDEEGGGTGSGTATMRLVADHEIPNDAELVEVSLDDAVLSTQIPTTPLEQWEIAPGEHLWRVARVTLEESGLIAPDDRTTMAYLQELIDHNRDVLVDPTNPDLVLPGQVFELPVVPLSG